MGELRFMRPFEKMQQEPPNRVCRAAAVVEHFGEARVAALHHILRERVEQVVERLQREIVLADDLRDVVEQ
jgi:hypothetical protein